MANVIEITDFSAPELDVYARLTEAQLLNRFEPAKGMFIAESPKVIHRALDGGYEPVLLLMELSPILLWSLLHCLMELHKGLSRLSVDPMDEEKNKMSAPF